MLKLVLLLSKLLLQKLNTNMKWDNTIHPLRKEALMGGRKKERKKRKKERKKRKQNNHQPHSTLIKYSLQKWKEPLLLASKFTMHKGNKSKDKKQWCQEVLLLLLDTSMPNSAWLLFFTHWNDWRHYEISPYVSHFKYLAIMVSILMTIWILTQADNVSREQICMQNHK